ncbi:MAG: glycosyltransferase family 4 protein [Verrucomicrobiota bacterium JB025]|nr:glycosyltransferase family 4 protein [Verrucomicrobiota bacterium JB025]
MRVAILANVPVWTLPDLAYLRHAGHYATWLEPLIPVFNAAQPAVDVHWITMCKQADRPITHQAHGQTFHILPRGSMAVSMCSGYLAETARIRSVIRRIEPDVVHAWGSEDVYGIAAARSGISKSLFTLQGCLTEYLRLLGGSFLFRVQCLYEQPTIRRYRHATAESPAAAELLKRIHPGLEVELVDYGVNREFFNTEWNPAPEPNVAFVGSVSKRKGIIDLVEVARRPELSHITFHILGDGPLCGELKASSPANVRWHGKCGRQDVADHLSRAWALVMPTYSDTGPTVIKEARVIGLPVITTTGAGASSYIRNEQSGHVITPGDQETLARALLSICTSREHCRKLGKVDWDDQRKLLHPATTAAKFHKIYQSL